MKYFLALLTVLFLRIDAKAQATYTISGTVKNTKGEKIQSATVFIAGTQKMTMTNADGGFSFSGIIPGNYQLVVNMLGYNSIKQNITINNKSEIFDLLLTDKEIVLAEVHIGTKTQKPDDLKKFIMVFIGGSYATKLVKILNPEIIDFVHKGDDLTATTSDFLIIENNMLGYRIKYLLKTFEYRPAKHSAFYDGDYIFEPMTGTPEQQAEWDKQRKLAYYGSPMHFYRSLFANTARQEGFLIYIVVERTPVFGIDPNPVKSEELVNRQDSNFFKFKSALWLYVLYDKKKAAKPDEHSPYPAERASVRGTATLFRCNAKVDSRGSISDYTYLNYTGYFTFRRVAYLLPYEYNPDQITTSSPSIIPAETK
jgi:hypothetical protein